MAFKINTVEFGTQRADQFQANPLNPRVHPQHQRDVINASLKRFGFITLYRDWETDRKSTRLNSSHSAKSRMPSSA